MSEESPEEVLGLKRPRAGNTEEVAWFVRKYLGTNEENFKMLCKFLTPYSVSRMLKQGVEAGMVLTWDDESTVSETARGGA